MSKENLTVEQIGASPELVSALTPKPRVVWHWILGVCPDCGTREQSPVRDLNGEDCNLFDKVDEWKRHYADTKPECECGKRLFVGYRHAMHDLGPLWKDEPDEDCQPDPPRYVTGYDHKGKSPAVYLVNEIPLTCQYKRTLYRHCATIREAKELASRLNETLTIQQQPK